MSGADHDDVVADHRRRVESDFAGDQIDLLVVVHLQVDDAVLAEARDLVPVLASSATRR